MSRSLPWLLLAAAVLGGCASQRRVDVQPLGDGRYAVEVARCGAPGGDDAQARADLERVAGKTCPGGFRLASEPARRDVLMAAGIMGECPAIRLEARIECEGETR
ncbi:hypothetical protein H0E84_01905 [Luteimonas sp. SJ-92]|uniref:Lipoprotein n=1 Tax=Luteimonas salinisoli TaxID=2752307 RepID=A0A853J8V5_9GAMM|nr:hypothetical protein [Luteimonas salinisoli]NZA25128.1 hypothetical protein [Luteimonas salinisoli]